LVTGIVVIVGFSIYMFMEPTPNSPKSGTKIQPIKKIMVGSPVKKLESFDNRSKSQMISNSFKSSITGGKFKFKLYYVFAVAPIGLPKYSLEPHDNNHRDSYLQVAAAKNTGASSLDVYENKDVPENYYSIGFPSGANVVQGAAPGGYIALVNGNVFSTELEDIPDDSNVQLYTLTHTEPGLKSSVPGYKLLSTGQLSLGKNRAWDIIYSWKNSTQPLETMKVVIEGKDEAAMLTFSNPVQEYDNNNSTRKSVLQSFTWL